MKYPYAVLQPALNVSDAATVLSVHTTLAAAMDEQHAQALSYGWAYCEARKLKVPVKVGDYISRRTHLPLHGGWVCSHCGGELPPESHSSTCSAVCQATAATGE